eukprot:1101107-Prorocentrum_minimum.AAC.1
MSGRNKGPAEVGSAERQQAEDDKEVAHLIILLSNNKDDAGGKTCPSRSERKVPRANLFNF